MKMKTKKKTTVFDETFEFNVFKRPDGAEIWWTEEYVDVPEFMPTLDFTPKNYEINVFQKRRDEPDWADEEEQILNDPEYSLIKRLFNKGAHFIAVVKREGNVIYQREYESITTKNTFDASLTLGKFWTFDLNNKANYF